jgi:hypothetical protein
MLHPDGRAEPKNERRFPEAGLLLPGALLMAIRAQLLAAFVFIDLCFPAFLK